MWIGSIRLFKVKVVHFILFKLILQWLLVFWSKKNVDYFKHHFFSFRLVCYSITNWVYTGSVYEYDFHLSSVRYNCFVVCLFFKERLTPRNGPLPKTVSPSGRWTGLPPSSTGKRLNPAIYEGCCWMVKCSMLIGITHYSYEETT